MRQDILIKSDGKGLYDIEIDGFDFASAEGFESAIPTSFFTDARASAVQVQEAINRRGWIGNILFADIGRELGGLLWLLEQARITDDTLNFAKTYCQDSLQWMIDDGLARSIRVSIERNGTRGITILTDVVSIENTVKRYVTLWRSTDFSRVIP